MLPYCCAPTLTLVYAVACIRAKKEFRPCAVAHFMYLSQQTSCLTSKQCPTTVATLQTSNLPFSPISCKELHKSLF